MRRADAYLPSEAQVQDSIVELLRDRLGYEVLEIGRWRKQVRCPGCGEFFTPHNGMPNTPGAPDLFVWDGARGGWVGMELKAPGGKTLLGTVQPGHIKPEQKRLADLGMTHIVHSCDEALTALKRQP